MRALDEAQARESVRAVEAVSRGGKLSDGERIAYYTPCTWVRGQGWQGVLWWQTEPEETDEAGLGWKEPRQPWVLTLEWTPGFTLSFMQPDLLTISQLAARVGTTPDTLRYYERLGLLPPPPRTEAGYRLYDPAVGDRVAFIRKAQALGLSLQDVREILRVATDGTPPCTHVHATLEGRAKEVEARIRELQSLRAALVQALRRSRALPLARSCVCEIIESQQLPPSGSGRATARRSPRRTPMKRQRKERP